MQIITKVVRAGHWYQTQIIRVEEITFSYVSGPDKGVNQKEISETVVLTFGKFFESIVEAETFASLKKVKSIMKLIQKDGFYF
jgi:hypothetical protein